MPQFELKQSTTKTGLRTVLLPRTEGETVTFLVLIGVGSRYETPRQSGLSHFLEHMFFKGTHTRPTAKDIAEAIDNVGGEFNAFTGEEYTGYYVKVAAQHLETGADVVSDILLHPLFPQEEIDRERGVITEEIRMYTDSPMGHVSHLWQQALFGTHPLGLRIDGSPETVAKFMRRDFIQYTSRHYHTGNAVVAVAGRFNVPQVQRMLNRLFRELPPGKETSPRPAPHAVPVERFVHEARASLDQTHLMVGVPGLDLSDPQRWALEVMSTILGSGMSSRLFLSVRERSGLAYAVRSSADSYTDAGSFVTQAGVRTDKAPKALALILKEYDRIMEEEVTPAELAKAKQMVRGHMLLQLEETNALALFTGMQELLEKSIESPDDILAHIDAVTAEQVQAIAQKLLRRERRAAALLGPQRSVKAFTSQLEV